MIDRVTPTLRPPGKASGYQRWRELLFLHWPVPAAALRPLVPARLTIDEHFGAAWVGVVAFDIRGLRPRWWPEAAALDFLETNVRTYVHLDGGAPGVWFFSLDAASRLAVAGARAGWGLPYFHADMRMERASGGAVLYELRRRGPLGRGRGRARPSLRVRYRTGAGWLGPSAPGSHEHFLLERYYLYAERFGGLQRGQVHHAPYPAERARVDELDESLLAAAGIERPAEVAPLVHYAAGVDTEVFPLVAV